MVKITSLLIGAVVIGLAVAPKARADAPFWSLPAFAETSSFLEPAQAPIQQGQRSQRAAAQGITVDREAVKPYAKWIIGAPVLVLFILILMLLRPRRKESPPQTAPRGTAATAAPVMVRSPAKAQAKVLGPARFGATAQAASDTQLVLQFFLRLFKRQQNLEPDADTQLELIDHRNQCPHDTYEIRVKDLRKWETRRMSIGLLGQGGGSRSRCFYVIYDSHLVIKIPSAPVTDFQDYNRQIAAEGRIVARLAPRLCIVPKVSVILNTLGIMDGDRLSEEEQEEKYIELLESKPALQEYLKLGGSFAFFMDLAKYFFLSTTLEEIHRGHVRLLDEISAYPDLLWDHNGFVGRYGEETGAVCHHLQNACRQCEAELQGLIGAARIVDEVPGYIFRQWFLAHLAGEKINDFHVDLHSDIIEQADYIIDHVLEIYSEYVDSYRGGLGAYIRRVRFSRHQRQLENLAANTLDLLAWIVHKDLALRDLKPENLFVAGNPKDYPMFLNDRASFSIGLIDVETAVILDGDDPERFPQPQLAGTPLYATPAHLLSNKVLQTIYCDLRTTLQMQDWHATMAILFKLVTGENLFAGTARVFPEIVSQVKVMDPNHATLERRVVKINRLYWTSALAEFQEALHNHHAALNRIIIAIPELLVSQIRDLLAMGLEDMEHALYELLKRQSFFSSKEKLHFLKNASVQKIGRMKNRLVRERDGDDRQDRSRSGALLFFKQLERLKDEQKRKQSALEALDSPCPAIPADQLLDAMFQKVFQHMYPAHWPALTPAKYRTTVHFDTDITTYQAIL